jgi:glutamate-5-semialdehyde dehydrogenase
MNKYMNLIGIKARKASAKKINTAIKNKVLNNYADLLAKEKKSILRENIKDVKQTLY